MMIGLRRVAARRGAFTLIEVLVVISIISLLLGLLSPSLGKAREAARAAVCGSMQRQLAIGQSNYASANSDFIAGPNTSGLAGQVGTGAVANGMYSYDKTGETPTTTHDWISPCMGASAGLPDNRAMRTAQIFNMYRCPSARVYNQEVYEPGNVPPDMQQFRDHVRIGGFRQISYLSPASFHYVPEGAPRPGPGATYGFSTPVEVRKGYRPRLDLVGLQPSTKVLVADGTRYLAKVGLANAVLDFDPDCRPTIYGSFLAAGPTYHNSVEYGRGIGGQGAKDRHKLSFRHGGAGAGADLRLVAAYFDGHVGSMKAEQAWTDAAPWYPGGSTYKNIEGTPESQAFYAANPQFKDIP